jgi:hypothetical protein
MQGYASLRKGMQGYLKIFFAKGRNAGKLTSSKVQAPKSTKDQAPIVPNAVRPGRNSGQICAEVRPKREK